MFGVVPATTITSPFRRKPTKELPQARLGYVWGWKKAVISITGGSDGFRKKGSFGVDFQRFPDFLRLELL